jgi:hypothetical protein
MTPVSNLPKLPQVIGNGFGILLPQGHKVRQSKFYVPVVDVIVEFLL